MSGFVVLSERHRSVLRRVECAAAGWHYGEEAAARLYDNVRFVVEQAAVLGGEHAAVPLVVVPGGDLWVRVLLIYCGSGAVPSLVCSIRDAVEDASVGVAHRQAVFVSDYKGGFAQSELELAGETLVMREWFEDDWRGGHLLLWEAALRAGQYVDNDLV